MGLEIGGAGYGRAAVQSADLDLVKKTASEEQEEQGQQTAENTDSFTHSAQEESPVYKPNEALVKQLKADLEQRQTTFLNTVRDMLSKQGKQVSGEGVWKVLASGDFEVDAETQAEAQKNIADDGYWGVEQTSERLVKYATALTGGDPDKLDAMIEAFEKGYAEAAKAWGGELPELCQRTRERVLERFEELREQNQTESAEA